MLRFYKSLTFYIGHVSKHIFKDVLIINLIIAGNAIVFYFDLIWSVLVIATSQ